MREDDVYQAEGEDATQHFTIGQHLIARLRDETQGEADICQAEGEDATQHSTQVPDKISAK